MKSPSGRWHRSIHAKAHLLYNSTKIPDKGTQLANWHHQENIPSKIVVSRRSRASLDNANCEMLGLEGQRAYIKDIKLTAVKQATHGGYRNLCSTNKIH
jgi:hypothetical protein